MIATPIQQEAATGLPPAVSAKGYRNRDWPLWAYLLVIAALTFIPFAIMLLISVKSSAQYAVSPIGVTPPFHFENYLYAIKTVWRPVFNSSLVAVVSIAGTLAASSLTAFAFALLPFPGRTVLFFAILALLMIPGILLLVPRYVIVAHLHLLNSYFALILPYIAGGQAFNVLVLRTFFTSIPGEIVDAARVDGAGYWKVFTSVVLPLSRPIMAAMAILQLLSIWNDYIWPAVTIDSVNLRTLTVSLRYLQDAFGLSQWGAIMASYTVASLPLVIVFALTTRTFIQGMTSGALKV